MIRDKKNLYFVILDRDFNILATDAATEIAYPFMADSKCIKNLLYGFSADDRPFIAECGKYAPEKKLMIFPEGENLRCILGNYSTGLPNKYHDAVSYRMREPISGIFALLPVITNSINNDDSHKAIMYLENVHDLSYKLLRNVTNITTANRFINGTNFKKEVINLSSLLSSIVASVLSVEKDINIVTDIEDNIYINGNHSLLSTAFLNLIANSINFRNDEKPLINISLHLKDRNAVLIYSDNSKGIKDEFQPYVFNPYFSKDPYADGGADPDLGLGLYIVKKTIENSDGNILLTSSFGDGVKYSVSIPVSSSTANVFESNAADFLLNRYSEVFVQLCDSCSLPSLK